MRRARTETLNSVGWAARVARHGGRRLHVVDLLYALRRGERRCPMKSEMLRSRLVGSGDNTACTLRLIARARTLLGAFARSLCGKDHEDAIRINQLIETGIRVDPTQYLWMHRRFKTRPDNQKSFY